MLRVLAHSNVRGTINHCLGKPINTWTKITIVGQQSFVVIILACLSKLLPVALSKKGAVSSYNST